MIPESMKKELRDSLDTAMKTAVLEDRNRMMKEVLDFMEKELDDKLNGYQVKVLTKMKEIIMPDDDITPKAKVGQ